MVFLLIRVINLDVGVGDFIRFKVVIFLVVLFVFSFIFLVIGVSSYFCYVC